MNNIPPNISSKIGKCLYRMSNHPLCIAKEKVFEYFSDLPKIEIDNPYVLVENNFDRLRVPLDHPSRRYSNTYYKDPETILRTHMTCYLYPMGQSKSGNSQLKYISCGDVYRKDIIDYAHYPAFHQMDAFCIVPSGIDVEQDLRHRLTGLMTHLFGDCKYKMLEDKQHGSIYFPFSVNSLEIEVKVGNGSWLEILGAGTVHPDIMKELGLSNCQAWAFGLGLDRITLAMFGIPDIRLLWSNDQRFLSQFQASEITKFRQFSECQPRYKNISFVVSSKFTFNDMCCIARDIDHRNVIELISLMGAKREKNGIVHNYQITYRCVDRDDVKFSEINKIHKSLKDRLVQELEVRIKNEK